MAAEPGSRSAGGASAGEQAALRTALKRALEAPGDDTAWNEAETLAAEAQRFDEVAAAYVKALKQKAGRAVAAKLAQRALRVQEEWLGADSEALEEILQLTLTADPTIDWAFERLTLILSIGQRWEDLLALYDRVLTALPDGARRRSLLLEAAGVAKDFLGNIDRAIGYLEQLFRARPADAQVASSLERLLERQGAWDVLAKVWETRLSLMAGPDARELREKAAALYLDKLGDGERALGEAQKLLESGGDDTVSCQILERILSAEGAPAETRGRAMELLRGQHEKMGREGRIVSALRVTLGFAPANERIPLLRETAERLQRQGDTVGAMEQIIDLLAHVPNDAGLRSRLAHLANTTGRHEGLVRGLLAAAGGTDDPRLRVGLLIEAAQAEEELLHRPAQAVALYQRVVEDEGAEEGRKLAVLRRLVDLLGDDSRASERLAVLERVAELERGPGARKAALGEAAQLGTKLGDRDRAATAWRKRLVRDTSDREALDALVELAAAGDNHELLVEALRARVTAPVPDGLRRSDLVRIAEVQAGPLNQAAAAVETWREIEDRFGEDAASVTALRKLLSDTERWRELLDRLARTAESERGRLAELCQFLGDVCRLRLDNATAALAFYTRSLGSEPTFEASRAGLWALLDGGDQTIRPAAVQALVQAAVETDDFRALLDLLDDRLALATDRAARGRLAAEAAELAERRAEDPAVALRHAATALGQVPEDGRALAELMRLAAKTSNWTAAAEALEGALAKLPEGGERGAQLGSALAQIREERLNDREAALAAYEAALRAAPERFATRAAVVRLAAASARWNVAVEAMLLPPIVPEAVERDLLPLLEKGLEGAAAEGGRTLAEALTVALGRRPGVPRTLARDLEIRAAGWAAHGGGEQGAMGKERALARAVSHDPLHVPTLERLAEAQRLWPGRPLYDTLMSVAALSPATIDPLLEAAEVARTSLRDPELERTALRQLLDQSVQLLRTGAKVAGVRPLETVALQAVDGLSALLLAGEDPGDSRRSVDLLVDASHLPLAADISRALLRRAGKLSLEAAKDPALARDIYKRLLDQAPEDREATEVLARLYEQAELYPELLILRRRTLGLGAEDGEGKLESRLAGRLELVRIGALVEGQAARVPTLLTNLEEAPGHAGTVAALSELLRSHGRHGELADVLTTQARKLEERGEQESAGRLWAEVASLADQPLADVPRAIAAHERVAALLPATPTLDALARLYLACGEPITAAGWLEQRLASTTVGPERVAVARQLAEAYVAAGQRHRAVGCLERVLQEVPGAEDVRISLIELYRAAESPSALADALAARALHSSDREVALEAAEEAVALYRGKLKQPGKAVPVLERALSLSPTDRALRTALADSLRAAGRPAEARATLQPLLEVVGRRRSRDRATIHHQMALAARDEGDLKLALEHLEQAASMVMEHMPTQLALAEVAEEGGDLVRAEQAYRALLVLARRGDPAEAPLVASEVLLRLERVARARGQAQAAAECFDSAMATAMQSPPEARRLQAALLDRGDAPSAISLLEKRRAAAGGGVEEARVACELAAVLATQGREAEALEIFLKALEKVPEHSEAHEQTRALAKKMGQSARYLDTLLGALDQRRRWDDGPRVAELLLRAGEVAEIDLGDPRAAAAHYGRAEQTGARTAEALTGLARVSLALGDTADEAGAIERLQKLATAAPTTAAQADVLYRLAERQLASDTNRPAGLGSLAQALERAPDFVRALALVRAVSIPDEELPRVMPLYEKVARASGNDRMLLDFLERRSASPQASQGEVREGVELALSMGERGRAEVLLERAVALGRQRKDGMKEASWALVELAEHRRSLGDLDGAARLLDEGREASGSPRVLSALRDIAREAARQNKTALAARILERLREAYPTDRDVWQPLLELYAQLGDRPSMERLVQETTSKLLDRVERNLVRMAWARFLVTEMAVGGGVDPVTTVLRDVLLDEPGQPEAVLLLSEMYERRGEVGEAVALLSEALRESDVGSDDTRRAALVRRLAELVSRADPAQAKQVYRAALAAPFADSTLKRSLQTSLLEHLVGDDEVEERAALSEDILAGETGEGAARLALELYGLRKNLGDERGARRALELGRTRAPGNRSVFERLEAHYVEGNRWRELVDLLADEAPRVGTRDRGEATILWRRAARIRREKLGDQTGAADLLRHAALSSPGDPDLLRELSACLIAGNRIDAALEEVSRAIASGGVPDESRVGLLRLRAELRSAGGDDSAAVQDLEEAFSLGGLPVAAELTDALIRYATRCANEGMHEAGRGATLRLAEVLSVRGEAAQAQDLLFAWVESHPEDHEALRVLRQRFEADGRWDEAAQVCVRLLEVEQGDAKIDAALALAEACEHLGNPADAIPTLEGMLEEVPGHRALLLRLVRLFQLSGNPRRAGSLLVDIADNETDEDARFSALTEAADLLLREGDPPAAFAALEKAVQLKPKDRIARRLLADASLAAGLYQEALDVIGGLLGETRGVTSAEMALLYQRLGRAAAGLGDAAGQLQALKRALDADRRNGEVASELADLAEQVGDFDLALRALRAVTLHAQNGPLSPAMAFYRQARIVHRQGDRPRALIFTKRALQEDPELGVAREFLQELA